MKVRPKTQERKLPKSSLIKPIIQFYSVKNRAAMFCESELEVDALKLLEFSPNVTRFATQPKSFEWKYEGRKFRYTPDILVKFNNEKYTFVEVKPREKARELKFLQKFSALRKDFLKGQNTPLRLILCTTIQSNDEHIRRHHLYRYLKRAPQTQYLCDIGKSIMTSVKTVSIGELIGAYADEGYPDYEAWTFLAREFSRIDFFGKAALTTSTNFKWSH